MIESYINSSSVQVNIVFAGGTIDYSANSQGFYFSNSSISVNDSPIINKTYTVDPYVAIVNLAKSGNQRAFDIILKSLEPNLKKIATKYYISGSDYYDVLQEGRIGVWKAVLDFDVNGGMKFKNFALGLCCKRHIITAMAAANRKKFDILNNAISLATPVNTSEDDSEQYLSDFIPDSCDLVGDMIKQEEFDANSNEVRSRLTQMEEAIYLEYGLDESYKDIAKQLNIKPKAVDNALMRIRKKATQVYEEYLEKQENDKKKNEGEA